MTAFRDDAPGWHPPLAPPAIDDPDGVLWHGDCLDVLRTLPDDSVDAVVTDPPYGLTEHKRPNVERALLAWLTGDREHVPDGRGFMGRSWDAFVPPPAVWDECFRVLKPGGHLLAFCGSRTIDLMMMSIRLAGLTEQAAPEIRDSIAWLYGSGFPKSLDVSKAIDKARDDYPAIREVVMFIRATVAASGIERSALDEALGGPAVVAHFLAPSRSNAGCPRWDQWLTLKRLLNFGDMMDAEVWRLNGRKGTPGDAFASREVIGSKGAGMGSGQTFGMLQSEGRNSEGPREVDVTAPATDAARQWAGWGTALKPSHEPVVVARKPAGQGAILAEIGSHLDRLEAEWQALAADPITRTGAVADSSAATAMSQSASMVETCSNIVTSWRKSWADLSAATSTSTTGTTSGTITDLRTLSSCLSRLTVTSMLRPETSPLGLTSLASAADNLFASAVCALRATLALSATEPATASTPRGHRDAAGSGSPAFEPIVVARKPLTGTVAANVQEWGTGALNIDATRVTGEKRAPGFTFSEGNARCSGSRAGGPLARLNTDTADGRWPANVVLDGTQADALDEQSGIMRDGVATNRRRDPDQLASEAGWGYRKQTEDVGFGGSGGASRFFKVVSASPTGSDGASDATPTSRPASSPSAERERSMATADPVPSNTDASGLPATATSSTPSDANGTHGDSAADFPTFRYQAKAPTAERPTYTTADGRKVAHPTVKPLGLMRWLVRLVTPVGGTVLDLFAGSGPTVEACLLEGMRCVAIEKDPDSIPLTCIRVARVRAGQSPGQQVLPPPSDEDGPGELAEVRPLRPRRPGRQVHESYDGDLLDFLDPP